MGVISFIKNKFLFNRDDSSIIEFETALEDYSAHQLAVQSAINHIAGTISKCEFLTYRGSKKKTGEEYYLWNFEPNKNENGSSFKKKIITTLLKNNEALIVDIGGSLYLADTFYKEAKGIQENTYKNVVINGEEQKRKFAEKEVIHFELNSESVLSCLNSLNAKFNKLIQYTDKAYKRSKGLRGVLNISANAMGSPNSQERINKIFDDKLKPFFENDNSVLPLYEGFDFQEIANKKENTANTRDIKSQIDDIFDFVARAYNIPPAILKGDVLPNKELVDNYLMFCITPIIELIECEINRKRNGRMVQTGTKIKISILGVKHIDIVNSATAVDKLIASGVCSINDILEIFEMQKVAEKWADTHYITKNYTTFEEIMKGEES